jgi:hypothetical protein
LIRYIKERQYVPKSAYRSTEKELKENNKIEVENCNKQLKENSKNHEEMQIKYNNEI